MSRNFVERVSTVVDTFIVPVEHIPDSQMHVSGSSCRNALL
jgi:hypothetical protein